MIDQALSECILGIQLDKKLTNADFAVDIVDELVVHLKPWKAEQQKSSWKLIGIKLKFLHSVILNML